MRNLILIALMITTIVGCAPSSDSKTQVAAPAVVPAVSLADDSNAMDELDPYAADIEDQLNQMDSAYIAETRKSPFLDTSSELLAGIVSGCKRETCAVYALVRKSEQRMYLYENGLLIGTYKTSTGASGHGTPDFDTRPNGRIYDSYTSTKYPGGDYNGLGNMPYAVFISGGFAIHGTGKGNWSKLGTRASHGCIRVHPDNGFIFNRLVRKYGISQTWITVKD